MIRHRIFCVASGRWATSIDSMRVRISSFLLALFFPFFGCRAHTSVQADRQAAARLRARLEADLAAGSLTDAERSWRQAQTACPGCTELYDSLVALGYLQLESGRDEQARNAFQQVRGATDYLGLHHLGGYYNLIGRFDEAERHYLKALKAEEQAMLSAGDQNVLPTMIHTLHDLAYIYSVQKKTHLVEAIRPRLDALVQRMSPPRATELIRLAHVQLFLGRNAEAKALFIRALSLPNAHRNDVLEAHLRLAELEAVQGRFREAHEIYRLLLADPGLTPIDRAGVRRASGQLHASQGSFDEAEAAFRSVLDDTASMPAHPERMSALSGLARLYVRMERLDEAERRYDELCRALEHRKASPALLGALRDWAEVKSGRGRYEEAELLLKRRLQGAKGSGNPSEIEQAEQDLARLHDRARSVVR